MDPMRGEVSELANVGIVREQKDKTQKKYKNEKNKNVCVSNIYDVLAIDDDSDGDGSADVCSDDAHEDHCDGSMGCGVDRECDPSLIFSERKVTATNGYFTNSLMQFACVAGYDHVAFQAHSDQYEKLATFDESALHSSEYMRDSVKFDTGSSTNLTGSAEGLVNVHVMDNPVGIRGCDSRSIQRASIIGTNPDGLSEMVVPHMSSGLTLRSGNVYVKEAGAAVLFPDSGVVLSMTAAEQDELKVFLSQYPVKWNLKVVNRTYEFDNIQCANVVEVCDEVAYDATATRYFNTKVNISNGDQRVLTMMLMGFSFQDLYSLVSNKSLGGMPPDLTKKVLNRFSHLYGRTPDLIRLANPIRYKTLFGLMTYEKVTAVGERIEVDQMFPDGNVTENGKTRKLESFSGATSALVYVDVFSGCVFGKLLAPHVVFVDEVKEIAATMKELGVTVKRLSADSGIVSNSKFDDVETVVQGLLKKLSIEYERVEPNNHSRGGAVIEVTIRLIKQMIRLATVYILTNENFDKFGFDRVDIFRMWGELFHWAIAVINLKPSPMNPSKTRYEMFYKKEPNMQNIRLLPIFSCVQVYRPVERRVILETVNSDNKKVLYSTNQPARVVSLFVGPALRTEGGIRAAAKINGKVQIYVTSMFTAASDGGGLNIHKEVEDGVKKYINEVSHEGVDGVTPSTDEIKLSIGIDTIAVAPDTDMTVEAQSDQVLVEADDEVESTDLVDNDLVQGVDAVEEPADKEVLEKIVAVSKKKDKRNSRPLPVKKSETKRPLESKSVKSTPTHSVYKKLYDQGPSSRAERLMNRQTRLQSVLGGTAELVEELEEACCAIRVPDEDATDVEYDWCEECYYLNLADGRIYVFGSSRASSADAQFMNPDDGEVAFKVVTGPDLPKTFKLALEHPFWGEPARAEFDTLKSTHAIVEMDKSLAKQMIANRQADLVVLMPVYEKKLKRVEDKESGKVTEQEVGKVRLVGDGRTHYHAGETYSSTPSREELLVLYCLIACFDWHYAHVDEVRAFLKAKYAGEMPVIAKMRGLEEFYQVLGALYGLRTSPRDYQHNVQRRMKQIGLKQLLMCQCMYMDRDGDKIVIVYDFVDDFIFAGHPREYVEERINALRAIATTTEPIWDATRVLGLQIKRDRANKCICITMADKIAELHEATMKDVTLFSKRKNPVIMPMPTSGYIIKDDDFAMLTEEMQAMLNKDDVHKYMSIVGGLIWISGIRVDILFVVMYLSWSTRSPRGHHLHMARYCVEYLYQTRHYPLVLGGPCSSDKIDILGYTDASLGTASKGRSVRGHAIKLMNDKAGAVLTKTGTSLSALLSSFEAELDGAAAGLKSICRIRNILTELQFQCGDITLYTDNKAMLEFIKGNGVAKGVRHMELRLWYVRDKRDQDGVKYEYMPGIEIPVDKFTKLGDAKSHSKFTYDIMGHALLYDYYYEEFDFEMFMTCTEE